MNTIKTTNNSNNNNKLINMSLYNKIMIIIRTEKSRFPNELPSLA